MRRLLCSLLILAGCADSSQLCSTCAQVAGSYDLTFGTPASSDTCNALGITEQNGPLTVTQVGSSLYGTYRNLSLAGDLTQDARVTLSGIVQGTPDGGTGSDSVTLSGVFSELAGADGGSAQIVGTFSGQYTRSPGGQAKSCSLSANFTARR